jgi:CubicO group peptidase (beta-lactamase class C family)
VGDGTVRLNATAADHEPLLRELYPAVTFRHFATMTSGYDAINDPPGLSRWGDPSDDWSSTPYRPAPPMFVPGTRSRYFDDSMMMFGRVLTNCLDRSMKDFLDERLMSLIGVRPEAWKWDVEGLNEKGIPINNGCSLLHISALDLARFGHLLLNKGNWDGRRILDEAWVRQVGSVQVPSTLPGHPEGEAGVSGRYGFNLWVHDTRSESPRNLLRGTPVPSGTIYTSGMHNNRCFIIPAWEMVVARTSGRSDGNALERKDPAGDGQAWRSFFSILAGGLHHEAPADRESR